MPFLGLCRNDPLMDVLIDQFGANALRLPDSRLQPLSVLACRDGEASYWGPLDGLLTGGPVHVQKGTSGEGPVPKLEQVWSRATSWHVGFNVLSGFLGAFGVPGAGIAANAAGVTTVAFSFSNVRRSWLNPALLGRSLEGRRFDVDGPATRIFFTGYIYLPLLITDIITSNQFSIDVDQETAGEASLDVEAIKTYVGDLKVGVSVKAASKTRMTFEGPERLTFAYTCYPVMLDDDGSFYFEGTPARPRLAGLWRARGDGPVDGEGRFLFGGRPGLVELL